MSLYLSQLEVEGRHGSLASTVEVMYPDATRRLFDATLMSVDNTRVRW